jgi:glutamyl-tRNA synthetase
VAAVRANLVLPRDAAEWGHLVYGELPCAAGEVRAAIEAAGPQFFASALASFERGADYARLVADLKQASGLAGRALFGPLRAALTQRFDGPELARLLTVIPAASVGARLLAARDLAQQAAASVAAGPP